MACLRKKKKIDTSKWAGRKGGMNEQQPSGASSFYSTVGPGPSALPYNGRVDVNITLFDL